MAMLGAFNPYGMIQGIGDAARVQEQRVRERSHPRNLWRMNINTLPDMRWDAFFGALQRKEGEAAASRKRFRADLVGRRGTDGIGTLRGQEIGPGASRLTTFDIPRAALSGLKRASFSRRPMSERKRQGY